MLQTFLPVFAMTFGICLFIVLMQFLWRYIDDMVGKGLDILVLGEMLMYAALSLVPLAIPLAILLASLMTFGNLGERLELLAMKAAGVSLLHIMRPLIITICITSVGAFFFQNDVIPKAQVKLFTLLYSIRQKSPELDIPEGVFYGNIPGYNVYVKHKDKKTGMLREMMIYNYSEGFDNAQVIVSDSGKLKPSANKKFLLLTLYNGESFKNLKKQEGANKTVPYQRETFTTKEFLIEFDANFTRMDDSFMENQYLGKNLKSLQSSIDSMSIRFDSIGNENAQALIENSYKRTIANSPKVFNDGKDTVKQENTPEIILNYDSLYQAKSLADKSSIITRAKSSVESIKADYYFKAATMGDDSYKIRRHTTEWHKKFTFSFACLVFFFIGAPLGAIIRKGGLGMPVVISVALFIFYYIIDNIGFKMARDGVWEAWQGMWLSSAILAPLGIFLTYKAVNDSVILNADTYVNALKNILGKRAGRNTNRKEVIIFDPNYRNVVERIDVLNTYCSKYLEHNKRWIPYFKFWIKGHKDTTVASISTELENIIEEMGNSNQNLLLNKLMDYPILGGYGKQNGLFNDSARIAAAILFPIGIPVYLIAMYQRKLLIQDIVAIRKVNSELKQLINDNLESHKI